MHFNKKKKRVLNTYRRNGSVRVFEPLMRGYYSKRKNEDLGNIQSQSSILLKANQFDLFG